jgi:hypothetical protein
MADETVEIDIKVKNDILPTIAELKELKRQLKETTDPEEFARLQRQIEDTTESINAAKVGAGNFFDVLGKLPGPIGFIGGQAAGLVSSLKQFGQIKFSNIAQSFTELKNDFVDIAKGIGNVTGLTTVYTTVTNASARALQFFGVSAQGAAAASRGLGIAISGLLAATGLILLVGLIEAGSAAWDYYANKAERAEQAQKDLNDALLRGAQAALDAESKFVKRNGDLLLAQAKAKGASADKIYKIEQQNRELLLASQTRYYNELKDKDSKEAIDAQNAIKDTQNDIAIATANFQGEQLQRNKDAAAKNLQISQQQQAELKRLAAEDKKAFDDMMAGYQKELDEYYDRRKNLVGVEIMTQAQLRALDAADAAEKAAKQKEIDDKRIAEQMRVMGSMTNYTLLAIQKEQTAKKTAAEDENKLQKWLASEDKKKLDAKVDATESALDVIGALIDQNSVAGKGIAIAQAIINTYQGATKALAQGGIAGTVAAAAVIAAGFINIKKIISTPIPSARGEGKATGGASGGGTPTPAFAQPAIAAPQIGATANQQGQLAGIVAGALDRNNSEGRPIRAYVVGNDITTEQQLQRRIRTAARLGG